MEFKKITDRIYFIPQDDYRPAVIAVMGDQQTLLIGPGATVEEVQYLQHALDELDCKADYLVVPNGHWEHCFGLAYWPKETISIAHEKTLGHLEFQSRLIWDDDALYGRMEREEIPEISARLIKQAYPELKDIQIDLPKKYYASMESLDLGGITVEIHYLPSDHSDDNSILYIPEQEFLFLGDVLMENIHGESWFYTYHKLASVIDRLRQWRPQLACESHGEPMGLIDYIDLLNFMETVNEAVRIAMDSGNSDEANLKVEEALQRPLTKDEEELIRSCLYGYFL
ncbi:MAG: hypothetical protein PF447_13090 [Spirochaetaceae bacterium]|nr:hypothetical protein [Spirochaetaceae bacterium]